MEYIHADSGLHNGDENLPALDVAEQQVAASSSLREKAQRIAEGATLGIALSPFTNGPIRYGSAAATLAYTGNSLASAAVLAGTTAVIEGSGSHVMSKVLDRGKSKSVETLNKFVDKFVSRDRKITPLAEAVVVNYLGVSAALVAKQRENPERTFKENVKHARLVTAYLSGACAVQGFLFSEGIMDITNPKVVAPAAVAIGGAGFVMRRAKNMIKTEGESQAESFNVKNYEPTSPNYMLTAEELGEIDSELTNLAKEQYSEPGVYAAWIPHDHKYANFIRTHEATHFPEVQEVGESDEAGTLFLALIDTRDENRIVHGATISGVNEVGQGDETGFISVDDLISIDGNFTADQFRNFYTEKGFDTDNSIGVETNFRIPKDASQVEEFNGLKMADLAYLTMFNLLSERGKKTSARVAAFASINADSLRSFSRVGIQYEPLMGRDDLVTAEAELGLDYKPVALPADVNKPVFDAMDVLKLNEVKLT